MSTDSDKPFHCQYPGCGLVRDPPFLDPLGPFWRPRSRGVKSPHTVDEQRIEADRERC